MTAFKTQWLSFIIKNTYLRIAHLSAATDDFIIFYLRSPWSNSTELVLKSEYSSQKATSPYGIFVHIPPHIN